MKKCSRCKRLKQLEDFGQNRSRKDGLTHYCRTCLRPRTDARRAAAHRYSQSTKGRETQARYRETLKCRVGWFEKLLRQHGIGRARWDELLIEQSGRCAICLDPLASEKFAHIDHDHATGKVRGILCHGCNTALGVIEARPSRLLEMARYLESHR